MPVIPIVAAGIGLAGSALSANAQSKAAKSAAAASQAATDQSIALQREQEARTWEATRGARELGNTATGRLNNLLNGTTNATDWTRSQPNYQVNLDAGQRQLNASAAARGGLLSGAAAREGLRYGADYATNQYQNAFSNLTAAAGLGQGAVTTGASSGLSSANNQQNALTNNASALSSSYQNRANAASDGFSGMTGSALYGLNNTNFSKVGGFLKGVFK